MLEELQDFGLSEKEAKVYLASLELGRATAEQLAKLAGVIRSTTYVQIESLIEMGLMSTYEEGKKTYFVPESPDHLKRIFEKKRQELDFQERELQNIIPELTRKFQGAGDRPVVRFFEGKEGLVTMRSEILKSKTKDMLVVVSHDDFMKVFTSEKERDKFTDARVAKKINTRVIYTKTAEDIDPAPITEFRHVPAKKFPFASDMYIYGDTIALASLRGHIAGVIIESPAITKSMRAVFELAWESARIHDITGRKK